MRSNRRHLTARPARVAVAAGLLAALVALLMLAGCTGAPADSGIEGTVTMGPVQPVVTSGIPDSRPYVTSLVIAPKDGLHLRRPDKVTSAENGRFRVNLQPGTYIISSASSQSQPTLAPIEVVVQPGRFEQVEVVFDSGIR